jgi:DNA-binding transcriptional LysR family regulator
MNSADLALFLEVARLGSFAAAAKARGVDPSSVSRAIAGLEADLGVRLFQRSTRRMSLTEAGDLYLTRALPLVEELERIGAEARQIRRRPSGTLRLTASVTFGQRRLVPLLPAFRALHPEVAVECLFTDANLDLIAERIDLAIRLAPAVEGDLIVTRLMPTRYRVVASPAYLASAPPLAEPQDMRLHRALLFTLRPFRTLWRFRDRSGAVTEVPVAGDVILSPAGAVREAALAHLGPALLPDWLIGEDLAAGRLSDPLPDHDVTATTFDTAAFMIYPSRAYLPAKVRAMMDFLRAEFA